MRAALKSAAAAAVALLIGSASAFAAPAKVLVAPFTEANENQRPDWIDRSIQQSLSDELTLNRAAEVVDFKPAGNQSPEEQAKAQEAQYVITGSVQRVAGEIRVSGRVDDVIAGKRIGSFKATGSERQLFAIEDSIAMQVRGLIGATDSPTTTMAAGGSNVPQLQTPFTPDNYGGSGFEGSDLQRAMRDPNLIRQAAMNPPTYPTYQDNNTYQQPLYPYTVGLNGNYPYGYGYGYGYNPYYYGSGWWWGGGGDVIVINNGNSGHGHDHGGGGGGGGHHHDGWNGNGGGGNWNGGGHWNGGGGNGGNGGGGFTPVADTNGQAIRRAATWMGNAPSTMTHTMSGPQLVPNVGGSMNNVPRGGPQMVPGAAVTSGRGGGAAPSAGGGAAVSGGGGGRGRR